MTLDLGQREWLSEAMNVAMLDWVEQECRNMELVLAKPFSILKNVLLSSSTAKVIQRNPISKNQKLNNKNKRNRVK